MTKPLSQKAWIAQISELLENPPKGCRIYAMDSTLHLLTAQGVKLQKQCEAEYQKRQAGSWLEDRGIGLDDVQDHLIELGPITDSGGW